MKIYQAKVVFTVVGEQAACPINNVCSLVEYVKDAFDEYPMQESFWVIYLNRQNAPIARQMISLGVLDSSLVHPRETFRGAILVNASSIAVAHNHPSGNPVPSEADKAVTRQLKQAGALLGIPLVDHIIIGDPKEDPLGKGYFSFYEKGFLF